MKSLVLNNFFSTWSGSEVVAIEVAEFLGATTSSFYVSDSFIPNLPSWVRLDNIDIREYDFVWAQHHAIFPLLDRLNVGDERPTIAMVSLSPYESQEQLIPSLCEEYADILVTNSEETGENYGESALVFNNAAPTEFHFRRQFGPLRQVLVVSNHRPPELTEAVEILRNRKIDVCVIGDGAELRRVTAGDIRHADVVVTIGKTVRYALASGTPVFMYDRFGGDGYLSSTNYRQNEKFNFSGRHSFRKLSSQTLADEIINNYRIWQPPTQPVFEDFFDGIHCERKKFTRHKDLSAIASMATALGSHLARGYSAREMVEHLESEPRLTGDAGSWAWLAKCLWKKIVRTPSDVRNYKKLK